MMSILFVLRLFQKTQLVYESIWLQIHDISVVLHDWSFKIYGDGVTDACAVLDHCLDMVHIPEKRVFGLFKQLVKGGTVDRFYHLHVFFDFFLFVFLVCLLLSFLFFLVLLFTVLELLFLLFFVLFVYRVFTLIVRFNALLS